MRIAPEPGGDLSRVRAAHDTVRGRVQVEWRRGADTIAVEVQIPPATTAEVVLPLHPDAEVHNVGEGRHRWSYGVDMRPPLLDLDSLVEDLAADPHLRATIAALLTRHLPNFPADAVLELAGLVPISELLDNVPGASAELRKELRDAIAAAGTT